MDSDFCSVPGPAVATLDEPRWAEAAEATDRRRHTRQQYMAAAWLSPEAEAGPAGKQLQVAVFDLSLGGVGFRSDAQLREGGVHWLVLGAGALRVSARLRVVATRTRDDGMFEVGGEFF
jgi:hypothetical protein